MVSAERQSKILWNLHCISVPKLAGIRFTEKLYLNSAVLKKLPFFAALFLTVEDRNCSVTASEKEGHWRVKACGHRAVVLCCSSEITFICLWQSQTAGPSAPRFSQLQESRSVL